jgi:hypothetical protein
VALVEQALAEQLGQRPPDALDVAAVVGDVGVLEVHPEANALGEALPLVGVAKDGLDAALGEGLDAVVLDLGLAVDAELLLHLHLDGEAVGVPAGFARDTEAAHRLVAGEEILDDAREDVAVVGQAVGGGRALVEDEGGGGVPAFERLLEDSALLPEGEDAALVSGEVDLVGDRGEKGLGHDVGQIASGRAGWGACVSP